MQQDWELIHRRATRYIISLGVKISIVIGLVCFVATLWPLESYQPLLCLDVLDLRDASHSIDVSILMQNTDRWPVQVHRIEFVAGGGWADYTLLGWTSADDEAEPIIRSRNTNAAVQVAEDRSILGGESAHLTLRLQPGSGAGQPMLRIYYRTVFWIPYSLDILLQNEEISQR